ncbi:MAG: helix-turn-helix domain-containing protein [Pseudomonadota bacterium]
MNLIKTDWHPARIKYELALRGLSLADIGRRRKLAQFSIYDVLRKRVPLSEQAVAEALGVHPSVIWPSRYDQN